MKIVFGNCLICLLDHPTTWGFRSIAMASMDLKLEKKSLRCCGGSNSRLIMFNHHFPEKINGKNGNGLAIHQWF